MKLLPLLLIIVLSITPIAAQNESTDYYETYDCLYWSAEMPSTWEVQIYTDEICTEYEIDTGTDPMISLVRYLNSWELTFYRITSYPDHVIPSNVSIDICHFIETLKIR
ncbi:MAG: hypothetical protein ACXQT2_04290 [Methanotrichaceae archaeon]